MTSSCVIGSEFGPIMQDVFASLLYSGDESRFYNEHRDYGPESIKLESITPKGVTLNGVIAESSIRMHFCIRMQFCIRMFRNVLESLLAQVHGGVLSTWGCTNPHDIICHILIRAYTILCIYEMVYDSERFRCYNYSKSAFIGPNPCKV